MGILDPKVKEGLAEWKDRLERGGFNTTEIRVLLLDEIFQLCLFEEGTIRNACALFLHETSECIQNILLEQKNKSPEA